MRYHSTLSKRDFMKALGLAHGSLLAAATARPLFHDLDEVVASPMAERKLPWWVKEADKPTVEIDWSTMKRFDARNTIFNPQAFSPMPPGELWPNRRSQLAVWSRWDSKGQRS